MSRMTRTRTMTVIALLTFVFILLPYTSAAADYERIDTPLEGAVRLHYLAQSGVYQLKAEFPVGFDFEEMHGRLRMLYPNCKSLSWRIYPTFTQITVSVYEQDLYAAGREHALPGGKTDAETVAHIADYILAACDYDYAAGEHSDVPFSPVGALESGLAVCDGYSSAFSLLCSMAGIPCLYVSSPEMNHSWNAVYIDNEIYYLDLTYQDTKPMGVTGGFILLTAVELSETHVWDSAAVEETVNRMWSAKSYPTRLEAAELLVNILGLHTAMDVNVLPRPFADADSPFVSLLYDMGYITGITPTLFKPESTVTPRDFTTMLLRVRGYAEGIDFTWDTALEDAYNLGLYSKGVYLKLLNEPFDMQSMYVAASALP